MLASLLLSLSVVGWAHDTPLFDDGGEPVRPEVPLATGSFGVVSPGPSRPGALTLVGRGERRLPGATTDVWVYGGYAYLGTFNQPCGDGSAERAGVRVYDVRDPQSPAEIGALPSVAGSRINDVKVAAMNGGTLLVHSNEPCRGGPGGFEIYDVADPTRPVHVAHVQTDSINGTLQQRSEHRDRGVHNLFLFTQGERDYVAAQVYSVLGSFQIFDITDPATPQRVSSFGAEFVRWPGVDWTTVSDADLLAEAETYLRSGYGQSTNRFLHDHYITPDGRTAYLANWDAGLIRLDISDIHRPKLVSVALEPDSEDGEVNSHSVWTSEDGRTVVEGEEDFSPYSTEFHIVGDSAAYASAEGSVTLPISSLPGQTLEGQVIYVGDACGGVPDAARSDAVALILRGDCTFQAKATVAKAAGYAGLVIFNHAEGGDELVAMGGEGRANIPGTFVGHGTGLRLMGVASADALREGAWGERISVAVTPSGWSGLRVWDYSDPARPVLASTFNTQCSAHPDDPNCAPGGTYSSHNLIVEDGLAYVSWYSEGLLVIDISDPYNPAEVARYHGSGPVFEAANGGPQELWGSYKVPGEAWIYASDRNGGLYVLSLQDGAPTAEVVDER